jgi:hypothetical protein
MIEEVMEDIGCEVAEGVKGGRGDEMVVEHLPGRVDRVAFNPYPGSDLKGIDIMS